ncbi:protein of unknown function [Candidatus Methylocalor cossyra]|uniref:Uncharacterized protein n=1 Tax=Candidatus Methylocalor cossyra TaxID=3108543 RepID=A0ABP1CC75_9GAMM
MEAGRTGLPRGNAGVLQSRAEAWRCRAHRGCRASSDEAGRWTRFFRTAGGERGIRPGIPDPTLRLGPSTFQAGLIRPHRVVAGLDHRLSVGGDLLRYSDPGHS